MKQWVFEKYGKPTQVLHQREVGQPTLARGQIGVRVEALSLNPIDWKLMSGKLRFLIPGKFPSMPCFDLAGVVEEDNGVAGFSKGDKVFVRLDSNLGGAAGTYAAVDAAVVAKMPEGLSFTQAASIPLAALTALQGLRDKGGMKLENAKNRVLVIGASGGVGHFAVQIAAAAGARVTAVCGTRNVEMVKSLGAHEVIDYRKQSDFRSADRLPYDIILDCIGETPLNFEKRFAPVLKKDGRYITPNPSGAVLFRSFQFWKGQKVQTFFMKPDASDLSYLARLYTEGKLKPVIDSVYPFNQLPQAFEKSMSGRAAGKIVVTAT